MNIVALVQVRMGSNRLPGKALAEILGKPILWHIVNRLKASELLNKIVIATSTNPVDKVIADFATENSIDCYAGSENDLVDRLYLAAEKFRADIIVRITADCPLADPAVIDRVVRYYQEGQFEYVGFLNGRRVETPRRKPEADGH